MTTLEKVDGWYILHKQGKPTICALVTPFAVPGTLPGTMSMQQKACGEMCPLFRIGSDDHITNVHLCHNVVLNSVKKEEKTALKTPFLFDGAKNL